MTAFAEPVSTEEELSPLVFDILQSAVNLARYKQIRIVAELRRQLSQHFPKVEPPVIDQALRFWAKRNVETGANAD